MTKFKVTVERRETYREHFIVNAPTRADAEELAEELNCEHDWTENEIIHGDETVVACEEVEE